MSLFKKPNRKFRQRTTNYDSEEESDLVKIKTEDDHRGSVCKDEVKTKPSLKLSFDDEEEESANTFKIRKSSYSKRMVKQIEKKKREKENPEKITPPKSKVIDEISIRKKMEKEKEELSITWVGKPVKSEAVASTLGSNNTVRTESDDSQDDDGDDDENDNFDRINRSNTMHHEFRGALERGVIPDAKTIYALKKQRQMARDAAEFIPIESDGKYDDEAKSRLGRDDENDKSNQDDDDEDDDDERINFTIDQEALEREKAREAFLLAQEEEEENLTKGKESEDELDKWEQEQIRKGVGAQNQVHLYSSAHLSDDSNSLSMFVARGITKIPCEIGDSRNKLKAIPSHVSRPRRKVTRDQLVHRLNEKLQTLRLNIKSHERQHVNLSVDIDQCRERIKKLELSLSNDPQKSPAACE